jgi:transcriptional regulator with XRE-family HTH domain
MFDARKSDGVDKHVGERVRMRRIMRSMSQGELAQRLGITFQQVQKYEKGSNRIGAGRLYRIAQILDAPVAFFFEDMPGSKGRPGNAALPDYLVDLMSTALGQRLVQAVSRVTDAKTRTHLAQLAENITEQHDQPGRGKR